MHFPVGFSIGSVRIEAHLIFEMLAYFLGTRYYLRLRKGAADTLSGDQRLWLIIGGGFGAAFGSKLLGFLEQPELWPLASHDPAYYLASKTIVGGLLGGLVGVELCKKYLGITRSTGDLFTLPVVFGMAIGRIGCFLAGVEDGTQGLPTNSFLGMDMGDGIPRHPASLYEFIFLLLLWLALSRLQKRVKLRNGALFQLFMAAYLLWRFAIDFIKPMYPVAPLGISAIQLACLLGLLYYHRVLFRPRSLLETG